MAKIIAGMYELGEKIGSGGGGIVYLGKHIRLNKTVVLKADKRTIDTDSEKLRREVDMLKELSYTNIPQVYDYVQEDGIVYTVMDYIEGESLDKILLRGERPKQSEVIKWACQLLQALKYLHQHAPYGILHGDIKPANIMLRPEGDVCLIDFNIALALGEDGAVKVGFSRGYASPEHYGISYIWNNKASSVKKNRKENRVVLEESTELLSDEKTLLLEEKERQLEKQDNNTGMDRIKKVTFLKKEGSSQTSDYVISTGSSAVEGSSIRLDVRSDIYSLGATLYHLLSGCCPEAEAINVVPLSKEICSPAVSAIIQKSMAPDIDMRYQTAEEMLQAFLQLYKKDERAIRHKRREIISSIIITFSFLFGGICTFVGLKQLEQKQKALAYAEYSVNALEEGKISEAINLALQAIPKTDSILSAPVTAQAQNALTKALGVYELSDGFKYLDNLQLPSIPFEVKVSEDNTYLAVRYAYEIAIISMKDLKWQITLPTEQSAMADMCFLDDTRIMYAGKEGVTVYDCQKQITIWRGKRATLLTLSHDKKIAATVNRDEEKVIVYDVEDGTVITVRDFKGFHMELPVNDSYSDLNNAVFSLNETGNLLAISFSNGAFVIYDLKNTANDFIIFDKSDYRYFEGIFWKQYFVYSIRDSSGSEFGIIDIYGKAQVAGYSSQDDILIRIYDDELYVANGHLIVRLDMETFVETEFLYIKEANITDFFVSSKYVLVMTNDNAVSFYDRGKNLLLKEEKELPYNIALLAEEYAILGNQNDPYLRLLQVKKQDEKTFFKYDAEYKHDEARIDRSGQYVTLFSYRGFQIYDLKGKIICTKELPNAEYIYDQQFKKSEEYSWLEVTWYDGKVRHYRIPDGEIVFEKMVDAPEKDLYEEFLIDRYRVVSVLHETPKVYEKDSGRLVTLLEEKAYLTYVSQIEDYILTEYISTEGVRYGVLLNERWEKIAYLPRLCDVNGNELIFDYHSGMLRHSRLYSLQELLLLGEEYIKNKQ